MNARRVVLGSAAMTGGHACRVALQFLLLPFLAVRLGPTAYGLVAVSMPVAVLAMLLGSGGLGAGLVRKTVLAHEAESSVFWFSLALGGALAAGLVALAGPLAVLLGERDVAPLLRGLSPIVILSCLCTVPNARLTRDGRMLAFAASDMAAALGGMGAALLGALHGWGAWSLVAQQLVVWSIKFVVLFRASRLRPRGVLAFAELRPLLGFGMNLVAGNLVDFCTRNADIYVISMSAGVRDLGFYAIAMQIVRLPDTVLAGPIFIALFPVIAACGRDRAGMARLYLAGLRAVALVALPMLVGLAAVAPAVAAALLGRQWGLTGTLLTILAPIGIARCLVPVNAALFLGAGRSDVNFRMQLAMSGAAVAGIAAGAAFGVLGVAVGYAALSLATVPLGLVVAARLADIRVRRIVDIFALPVVATAVMAASVAAVMQAMRADASPAALLILGVAAGVAAYGVSLAAVGGSRLYADFQMLRGAETRP